MFLIKILKFSSNRNTTCWKDCWPNFVAHFFLKQTLMILYEEYRIDYSN